MNKINKCFEYLGCPKMDCAMYKNDDDKYCWDVEETLCNHQGIELVRKRTDGNKAEACARSNCLYYRYAKKGHLV